MNGRIPHPFPYQGSKRGIAASILEYFAADTIRLIEPFAGSSAISIAAAFNGIAKEYILNDLNKPLIELLKVIVDSPDVISDEYESMWYEQLDNPKVYYDSIRDKFNQSGRPEYFLYLLARCVKGSVRYNANGEFNQSPDNRRKGMRPNTMRENLFSISYLLKGKTKFYSKNFRDILEISSIEDLIYMDPPYQGVCISRDTRYLSSVQYCEFVEALVELNKREIMYIVSYDGRTGNKIHGKKLPDHLNLTLIDIEAGVSSQSTLLGRKDKTIESLYLSESLVNNLRIFKNQKSSNRQLILREICHE